MITPQTIVSQSSEIMATNLDDKLVMMSISQGEYYSLESVGARIWNLIEKPVSISDLCIDLAKEFEVNSEECKREVLEFITKLLQMEIVKIEN